MKISGHFPLFLILTITLGSNLSAEPAQKWQEKMKELAGIMGDLLPELVATKSDDKRIEADAKRLSELVHKLKEDGPMGRFSPPPDADPSITYFATLFDQETKRAYWAMKGGYPEYGKNLLKTVATYCIACHTRHDRGPDFPVFPLSPKAKSLTGMEQAELLTATRQFDPALVSYEKLLSDQEFATKNQIDWQRAAKQALAITVRVKKDPDATMQIVDRLIQMPVTPPFVVEYVKKWKSTVETWKKEGKPIARTEKALAAQMNQLLTEAREVQRYPADHSADILYLRTTAEAHELLGLKPKAPLAAQALFVAGNAYEVLNMNTMSPLHEMYYEACVRRLPHSALARDCFIRYEESVNYGFTGSGGTSIPFEIQKVIPELDDLSKLAPKRAS